VRSTIFQDNYLSVGQTGARPIRYRYRFIAPSNTGVASGFDLNNDGRVVTQPGAPGYGDDALGFGAFPGQFGLVVHSRYPIETHHVRTFQGFLWKDMPGALLPDDPATPAPADWNSAEELAIVRLSSKSHWDLPIRIGWSTVHFLVSHPTPPVFDGPEDRNGRRNFDEIRFWADYVRPGHSRYIYDDQGRRRGLRPGAQFVIAGDQNSDPFDGDSVPGGAQQLLDNPRINARFTPSSEGVVEASALQGGANTTHRGNPAYDTADFADVPGPGNLRADYVLPSRGLRADGGGVFWPPSSDPLSRLTGTFPSPAPTTGWSGSTSGSTIRAAVPAGRVVRTERGQQDALRSGQAVGGQQPLYQEHSMEPGSGTCWILDRAGASGLTVVLVVPVVATPRRNSASRTAIASSRSFGAAPRWPLSMIEKTRRSPSALVT